MMACRYACVAARNSTVPPATNRLARILAACAQVGTDEAAVESVGRTGGTGGSGPPSPTRVDGGRHSTNQCPQCNSRRRPRSPKGLEKTRTARSGLEGTLAQPTVVTSSYMPAIKPCVGSGPRKGTRAAAKKNSPLSPSPQERSPTSADAIQLWLTPIEALRGTTWCVPPPACEAAPKNSAVMPPRRLFLRSKHQQHRSRVFEPIQRGLRVCEALATLDAFAVCQGPPSPALQDRPKMNAPVELGSRARLFSAL